MLGENNLRTRCPCCCRKDIQPHPLELSRRVFLEGSASPNKKSAANAAQIEKKGKSNLFQGETPAEKDPGQWGGGL